MPAAGGYAAAFCQALDGFHAAALHLQRQGGAGQARLVVHQHGAGAAFAAVAALLGAGQAQRLAQIVQQQQVSGTRSSRGGEFTVR